MKVLLDSSAYSLLMCSFLDSPYSSFIEAGPVTADHYARIAAALRPKGRPIPTNDVWIAAHAMETGADLVSADGHTETRTMPIGLSSSGSCRCKQIEDRKGYVSSLNILFNGQNALLPSSTSLLIRPSVLAFVLGLR